ncbi:sel1 repeat family protein [uncultured Desulfovibrio sp.]|uniref:tetratricopeptide repeat protein n=1 Tax=uncultured Desulfovibrio sp. TaxID=167968 RepID=UPI00263375F8|nr:sel1 repeat family protein [uncultured Desulfovibrio sp.]
MTGFLSYARLAARIIILGRRPGVAAFACLWGLLLASPPFAHSARAAAQIAQPQVQTPQVQTPQVAVPVAPVAPTPPRGDGSQISRTPVRSAQPASPAPGTPAGATRPQTPRTPDYSVPAQPLPALGQGGLAPAGGSPAAPAPAGRTPAAKPSPAPQAAPLATPPPETDSPGERNRKALDAFARGEYYQALRLWQEAAEAGDPQAMNNLGVLYDKGLGVEPDVGRALHWYAKSADAGHPSGMCNFGRMLEQGRGVPLDAAEAARWFDLAARRGQPEAQYNLGMLYEQGHGVQKDDAAAAAWYSRAATANQPDALARLGHFYRVGRVVKQDIPSATLLLYGAAMQGNAAAMKELESLAEATPERRANAVLFGQRLDGTNRAQMRAALKQAGAVAEREKDGYPCDVYKGGKLIPGAEQMGICYGPADDQPLAFVSIDYPARDASFGKRVRSMAEQRFGKPDAEEGEMSCLWNLGKVLVAVQYMPEKKIASLMYMIPRVYHLTQRP